MTVAVTPGVQRRAEITDAIRRETGIDEAMIERLVRGFYRRVREDALIGPVFAARIGDWEPHLARMCAFWSSVALMTGSYHGQPMQKHLPLPVDALHFDRWLALFEATVRGASPRASSSASPVGTACCCGRAIACTARICTPPQMPSRKTDCRPA
jgi:hemoglobin